MCDLDHIFSLPPYCMDKVQKESFLTAYLTKLTGHHYRYCMPYRDILDSMGFDFQTVDTYYDLPLLPVRLFKTFSLASVPADHISKTMTSSGTTGQTVSKIFLDKTTSTYQLKALTKIAGATIGSKRMPMIILDSPAVLKNRNLFSARGAGIRGFSIFGKDIIYAFDDEMDLDFTALAEFLNCHKGEEIFLFGFTFMIWQHFCNYLQKKSVTLDLSNAVMIHGGGWKKLRDLNISSAQFKQTLHRICGIERVYDYYGMVEQTGSIYMECDCGHLHASNFSDVIIRRKDDFSVADIGERGIVEVVSVLPHSYPGHALLTEDEGIILGEDNCPCGRKGKYISIMGRIKNAELRGCSDIYASKSESG